MPAPAAVRLLALAAFLGTSGFLFAAEPPTARVRTIVDETAGTGFRLRLRAAQALRGSTILRPEVDALWDFLALPPASSTLSPEECSHLRNDAVAALVHHEPAFLDTVGRLASMYRDSAQDRTWRDYCIQFLGQAYSRADEGSREEARAVLLEAVADHTIPTAGTALIALADNLADPAVARHAVAQAARAIARDPGASPGARVTAFQVCARLDLREAAADARAAARGETAQSVTVRMSAAAALGTLGEASDRGLLRQLAGSTDVRLCRAAAGALQRLDGGAAAKAPR